MYQRKRISIMLVVILLFQIFLPMVTVIWENNFIVKSIAASKIRSGDWSYKVNDDGTTITITEYRGTEEDLTIPSQIDGYTVTILGNGGLTDSSTHYTYSVFYFGNCIHSIKLPNTMKSVNSIAFMGCNNLVNIEMNEGLEVLGNQAFYGCEKLQEIIIPASVEAIGCNGDLNSFYGCISLNNITVNQNNPYYSSNDGILFNKDKTILIAYPSAKPDKTYSIPESVEQIYGKAIDNPNLENLYISKNVKNIKGSEDKVYSKDVLAIVGCSNLKNINVDENNEMFCSQNGVLFNKEKTALLSYPSGKKNTEYIIPSTVRKSNIIDNTYLEKIRINSLIYEISYFQELINLKNIEVDDENTNFKSCDGVVFNRNGDTLVYYPRGRADSTYVIDSNVTKIQSGAFANSKIDTISISDNVTDIGNKAFYNCTNLKDIVIPSNVNEIGEYAFYNCDCITKITIPKTVKKIGTYAFYSCDSLNELIFEGNSTIEQIGMNAFSDCSCLEAVDIPEGITNLDAFDGCENLRRITIPSSVSNIEGYSFYSTDTKPQVITINNENPTIFQRLGIFKSRYWGNNN